jgi:sterol desaturase/sphingolipid hydroxylase (fatty acid hydroxylase superfamily)
MSKKMSNNMNKLLFFPFLIFIYCVISLIEWILHRYLMHRHRIVKDLMDYFNINDCHLNHHKETRIDQSLPDNFMEEGIVFNIFDGEIIGIIFFLFLNTYLYWLFVPGFKQSFSLTFIFVFIFLVSNLYYYSWSSIHSHYHKRYIEANKPLPNNPQNTIYSPLRFFVPDESSSVYKYLYQYHTLHHLNKGDTKCNYNIICPLFDFIFGTYKSNVDNTLYFSKNMPSSEREEWLKTHCIFDIRITNNNTIEYQDKGATEWHKLPAL